MKSSSLHGTYRASVVGGSICVSDDCINVNAGQLVRVAEPTNVEDGISSSHKLVRMELRGRKKDVRKSVRSLHKQLLGESDGCIAKTEWEA